MKAHDHIKREIVELSEEKSRIAAVIDQMGAQHAELTERLREIDADRRALTRDREKASQRLPQIQAEIDALQRALAVLEDHTPTESEEAQPAPIAPPPAPIAPPPAPEIEPVVDQPVVADSEPTKTETKAAKDRAEGVRKRRVVENPAVGIKRPPVGGTREPITEGGAERLGATTTCRDEDVQTVLEILGAYGPICQFNLAATFAELEDVKPQTSQAIVSKALLRLRIEERAEWTGESEPVGTGSRPSKIWKATTNAEARA